MISLRLTAQAACAALAAAMPLASAANAATTIVRFDDTSIVGPLNTQYAAFGFTFQQSGAFSTARTYNDARDTFDGWGYAGTPERGNPTVLFTNPVSNLTFDFVSLGVNLIAVTLKDDGSFGQVISEVLPQGSAVTTGTRSFSGGGIYGFRVINIDQRLGISTLSFDLPGAGAGAVPEPSGWALMVGGFAMVGSAYRRRAVKGAAIRFS